MWHHEFRRATSFRRIRFPVRSLVLQAIFFKSGEISPAVAGHPFLTVTHLLLDAFEKINTNLAKIASGQDDAPSFNAIWQAAMRIVAIGEKIEKANSKENRDKVAKAIKDLVETL